MAYAPKSRASWSLYLVNADSSWISSSKSLLQRLSRHVITWNCCSEAKQLEYSLTIKYMQGKDICTYYQPSTWLGQRDIRSYLQRKIQEKFIMEETKWRRYRPSTAVARTAVVLVPLQKSILHPFFFLPTQNSTQQVEAHALLKRCFPLSYEKCQKE